MHPSRRRPTRRAPLVGAVLALLVGALAALSPSTPAVADAANCDLGTPTVDSSFVNSIPSAEKAEHRAFENGLRATGKYYLCGDFLTPPSTLPAGGNGTVIRVKPIYPSPSGKPSFAMRVMYKTTMRDGTVVPATTIVIIPEAAPVTERSIVAWAHPTVGINRTCRALLDHVTMVMGSNIPGDDDTIPDPGLPEGILYPFIQDDRVLVLPDYIGIGANIGGSNPGKVHPYLARETTGRTIIDAVRAAGNLSAVTGAGDEWALAGFSQGGLAAAGTAEVFPSYGTGLDLKGVVAVAGPGDMKQFFTLVNGASHPRGDRAFLAMAVTGAVADRWTVNADGTGGIINPATYLTSHASYVTSTFLRDANPYVSIWPWEASMSNAGEPWGSVNVAGPLSIGVNPIQHTLPAWWYDFNYKKYATAPFPEPNGPAIGPDGQPFGPYGSFSIPAAESPIISCNPDIVSQVYAGLPVNDVLKSLSPTSAAQLRLDAILQANSLGYVATDVPTVLIYGEDDLIAPATPTGQVPPAPATSKVWFDRMCGLGDPVRHVTVPDANHAQVVPATVHDMIDWVNDALDASGAPPAFPGSTGC